ncbi:MAG: protein phosphatase 2C domain-containing protein [Bryobacteraceae bacterium]
METRIVSAGVWRLAAATDTGLVRARNEDRYWADAKRGVFLVVDGVGGQAAGEIAAETAVAAIRESVFEEGSPEERVRRAIAHANNRIYSKSHGEISLHGMACVLTLALVEGGEITIGHVGDTRLYLIWNGSIRKLTTDHSPVGEDEEAGELSETEAMRHPRRNEIFRDVGSRPRAAGEPGFVEIRRCRFRPEAAILLCSDGLTDHLTAAEVREIVDRFEGREGDAERIASELVEAANARGGADNITVLFVPGPKFHGSAGATRPRLVTTRAGRAVRRFTSRWAFLAYGLLIGMLLWFALRSRG